MKKLSKEKRDKLALTCIVGLAGTVAVYYLLIGALRSRLEELDKQISVESAARQKAEKSVTLTEKYQKDVDDSLRQLQAEEVTMAPPDNRYFWFVNRLGAFRQNHKIDIPQTSPETVTEVGLIPKFPYKASLFKIGGTAFYEELGEFIADFENALPHARVQNLEIAPANPGGAQGDDRMKLSFTMDVLVLIKPAK